MVSGPARCEWFFLPVTPPWQVRAQGQYLAALRALGAVAGQLRQRGRPSPALQDLQQGQYGRLRQCLFETHQVVALAHQRDEVQAFFQGRRLDAQARVGCAAGDCLGYSGMRRLLRGVTVDAGRIDTLLRQ